MHTHYIPQWSCCHDSVLWVVMTVVWSAIQWHLWARDIYPSIKHTWSCRHPLPLHVTWSLHPSSAYASADIHGRSCSFPLIHPREVFLAWCWVITRPLSSHGVFSLSLPLGVGLTGWGWYICPLLGRHPHTRECQFLTWQGEVGCGEECVTVCIGPSLCMRGCLSQSDAPCPPTSL